MLPRILVSIGVSFLLYCTTLASAGEFFFDDFDGDGLKEHWEVINPDPDSFIAEDGNLLVVSSTPASLREGNVPNLFRLKKKMPQGDWIMSTRLKIDLQTAQEQLFFGLYDDEDNYITVLGISKTRQGNYSYDRQAHFDIVAAKRTKGVIKYFVKPLWTSEKRHKDSYIFSGAAQGMPQPLLLRLYKKGRSYLAAAMLEGATDAQWLAMEKLTAIRGKGNLVIGLYQREKISGETTATIDWVKIETVE